MTLSNQPPSALPAEWVERIFSHMACSYGAKFADMWAGQDPATVRAYWGNKLGRFSGSAIAAAISALEAKSFPPTLPEFIDLCRAAANRESSYVSLPAPVAVPKEVAESRAKEVQKLATSATKSAGSKAWAVRLRERYLAGGKLSPTQITFASEALGEVWAIGSVEITPLPKAA